MHNILWHTRVFQHPVRASTGSKPERSFAALCKNFAKVVVDVVAMVGVGLILEHEEEPDSRATEAGNAV